MREVFRKNICVNTMFHMYERNGTEVKFVKTCSLDGYWTRAKAEKELLCGDYAENHFIVLVRHTMQEFVYDTEIIRKYGKAVEKNESN